MSKLRNQLILALLLSSLVIVSTNAQDKATDEKDTKKEQSDEPQTISEIRQAIMDAQSEILKEYRKAKPGTPEQRAILARYYGVSDQYVGQIIKAVEADPSNSLGVNMLMTVVRMSRNNKAKNQAVDALFEIAKSRMKEDKSDRMATSILMTVLQSPNKMKQAEAAAIVMKLVKADPESDSSFSLLSNLASGPFGGSIKDEAQALLLDNFGDSDKMTDFAMGFARAQATPENMKFIQSLMEQADSNAVKGPATYALAKLMMANSQTSDAGEKMLKSIPKKYPDVSVYSGRRNLAEMVEAFFFEKERLQIGMEVPEIEGEDVDGVKFKLSDYRGKVVVIDFWGDW